MVCVFSVITNVFSDIFILEKNITLLTSISAAGSLCDVGVPHRIGTDPGEVPSDDGDREGC